MPWHVGHVMLSLPVNSTYGNWAMSSRLPSPSRESLSESLSSCGRPESCLSGRSGRLLPLRDHRVPMEASPPTTARLQVGERGQRRHVSGPTPRPCLQKPPPTHGLSLRPLTAANGEVDVNGADGMLLS